MGNKRVIMVCMDGVPFRLVQDLARSGVMDNVQSLIDRGAVFKEMRSSIPEVSSVAWTSVITGKNPAEHGVFGFTDLHPFSYDMKFPNYRELKADPFWDKIDGKSIIINVPSTYPVKKMNGVLISGFVSIDLKSSVHPRSLVPTLEEMDYRLDVDTQLAHQSIDRFLEDLDQTLEARIKAYRYLWDYTDWQVFMLVFTGTDRLMHFLWDAYEDSGHQYHDVFLDHFKKIDRVVGEVKERISDDDQLIMFSDHGFEHLEKEVYLNYLLEDKGFLNFKKSGEVRWSDIDYGTKAFALDPTRIYINEKGKYPCGSVESSEREAVLKELEELFSSLEHDGKKVIDTMFRKEEIYSGALMDKAPELELLSNSGFDLKARLNTGTLYDKRIFTGKHTQKDAFLYLKNDPGNIPDQPSVFDIAAIIQNSI